MLDPEDEQPIHAFLKTRYTSNSTLHESDLLNFTALLRGEVINAQDEHGDTPLLLTAVAGDCIAAQCLLENGADPFIKNSAREFALGIAVRDENLALVNCMLQFLKKAAKNTKLENYPYCKKPLANSDPIAAAMFFYFMSIDEAGDNEKPLLKSSLTLTQAVVENLHYRTAPVFYGDGIRTAFEVNSNLRKKGASQFLHDINRGGLIEGFRAKELGFRGDNTGADEFFTQCINKRLNDLKVDCRLTDYLKAYHHQKDIYLAGFQALQTYLLPVFLDLYVFRGDNSGYYCLTEKECTIAILEYTAITVVCPATDSLQPKVDGIETYENPILIVTSEAHIALTKEGKIKYTLQSCDLYSTEYTPEDLQQKLNITHKALQKQSIIELYFEKSMQKTTFRTWKTFGDKNLDKLLEKGKKLKELVMSQNAILNDKALTLILRHLPCLKNIDVRHNALFVMVPDNPKAPPIYCHSLETIDLKSCQQLEVLRLNAPKLERLILEGTNIDLPAIFQNTNTALLPALNFIVYQHEGRVTNYNLHFLCAQGLAHRVHNYLKETKSFQSHFDPDRSGKRPIDYALSHKRVLMVFFGFVLQWDNRMVLREAYSKFFFGLSFQAVWTLMNQKLIELSIKESRIIIPAANSLEKLLSIYMGHEQISRLSGKFSMKEQLTRYIKLKFKYFNHLELHDPTLEILKWARSYLNVAVKQTVVSIYLYGHEIFLEADIIQLMRIKHVILTLHFCEIGSSSFKSLIKHIFDEQSDIRFPNLAFHDIDITSMKQLAEIQKQYTHCPFILSFYRIRLDSMNAYIEAISTGSVHFEKIVFTELDHLVLKEFMRIYASCDNTIHTLSLDTVSAQQLDDCLGELLLEGSLHVSDLVGINVSSDSLFVNHSHLSTLNHRHEIRIHEKSALDISMLVQQMQPDDDLQASVFETIHFDGMVNFDASVFYHYLEKTTQPIRCKHVRLTNTSAAFIHALAPCLSHPSASFTKLSLSNLNEDVMVHIFDLITKEGNTFTALHFECLDERALKSLAEALIAPHCHIVDLSVGRQFLETFWELEKLFEMMKQTKVLCLVDPNDLVVEALLQFLVRHDASLDQLYLQNIKPSVMRTIIDFLMKTTITIFEIFLEDLHPESLRLALVYLCHKEMYLLKLGIACFSVLAMEVLIDNLHLLHPNVAQWQLSQCGGKALAKLSDELCLKELIIEQVYFDQITKTAFDGLQNAIEDHRFKNIHTKRLYYDAMNVEVIAKNEKNKSGENQSDDGGVNLELHNPWPLDRIIGEYGVEVSQNKQGYILEDVSPNYMKRFVDDIQNYLQEKKRENKDEIPFFLTLHLKAISAEAMQYFSSLLRILLVFYNVEIHLDSISVEAITIFLDALISPGNVNPNFIGYTDQVFGELFYRSLEITQLTNITADTMRLIAQKPGIVNFLETKQLTLVRLSKGSMEAFLPLLSLLSQPSYQTYYQLQFHQNLPKRTADLAMILEDCEPEAMAVLKKLKSSIANDRERNVSSIFVELTFGHHKKEAIRAFCESLRDDPCPVDRIRVQLFHLDCLNEFLRSLPPNSAIHLKDNYLELLFEGYFEQHIEVLNLVVTEMNKKSDHMIVESLSQDNLYELTISNPQRANKLVAQIYLFSQFIEILLTLKMAAVTSDELQVLYFQLIMAEAQELTTRIADMVFSEELHTSSEVKDAKGDISCFDPISGTARQFFAEQVTFEGHFWTHLRKQCADDEEFSVQTENNFKNLSENSTTPKI